LDNLRAALARLMAERRRPRVLLVSPTGSGKTTIAAAIIRSAVGRGHGVLFLAHRRELLDQCSERLDGVGIDHGVIQSGHPRDLPGLPVQVASVQTLVRRELQVAPKLIIIDEAHRARAKTYDKIIALFPEAVIIGLTATPLRMDDRGLGELFEELVEAETPAGLIARGHLVGYAGFAYSSPDLSEVKKRGSDYDDKGLERVMGSRKILGDIVEQWQLHAAGKRTVVFAVTVAHSLQIVERFRDVGVAAEHVDGETPVRERAAILKPAAHRRDHRGLERRHHHRGLRPPRARVLRPGAAHEEPDALPADGRPSTSAEPRQGAGALPRPRGLLRGARRARRRAGVGAELRRREAQGPARAAAAHLQLLPPDVRPVRRRPVVPELRPRQPGPVSREVVEVTKGVSAIPLSELPKFKNASAEEKAEAFARLRATAAERGYSPKWAAIQYKIRFRHWPPKEAA
jgi:hypothetical protein